MNALKNITACLKFYVFLLLIIFFTACNGNSASEDQTYVTLNESLLIVINSTESINNQYLHSLVSKLHDFETQEKAAIWYPKAQMVKALTDNFCGLVDSCKKAIDAGTKVDKIKSDNRFETLFKRLEVLKDSLNSIDKDISVMLKEFAFASKEFDIAINKDFYTYFFEHRSSLSAIAMLTSFQNNIRIIEQQVLRFCDLKSMSNYDGYDQFQAIVAQSKSYIKAGESIEINAGVGSFSKAAQPKITVNGKFIELSYEGVATTTIKGSVKPGKHYIPVSIEFTKPNGEKSKVEKTIEYTVAD